MAWQIRMCALVALAAAGACGNTEGSDGFDTGELDCESLDLACRGLDETECVDAAECEPIRGALWEGDMDACFAKPREFLGCAGCLMGYTAQGCVYRESAPERCYCMASTLTIPGWVDVFECLPFPGECGTTPQGSETLEK